MAEEIDPSEIELAPESSWTNRPTVLISSLVLAWPLGMSFLMRSRWPEGWNKALLAVVTLPVFVLLVAVLLWLSGWRVAPPNGGLREASRPASQQTLAILSAAMESAR